MFRLYLVTKLTLGQDYTRSSRSDQSHVRLGWVS